MSYHCTISFKQLKNEELYPFLQTLKDVATNFATDIVKDSYFDSPIFKWMEKNKKEKVIEEETLFNSFSQEMYDLERTNNFWVTKIFTYQWYWDAKHNVLSMCCIPKQLQFLFDNTTYFQNSCDQDYEFDEWQGINYMEEIAEKWKNLPKEELKEICKKQYGDDNLSENELEYYRKTFCYDEIWSSIEWMIYDDDKVVYLSLFSTWGDYKTLKKCVYATIQGIKENWINREED